MKLYLLFLAALAQAADVNVSSIADLQTAIKNAKAGDVLILANGTYLSSSINITTGLITVRSATPGGVFLNGATSITIPASNVTLSGFQFTNGSIPGFVVDVKGSNNTLTQLNFNGFSAQKYVVFRQGSQRNSITYSNFQNKPASAPIGNLVESEADPSVPGYHVISHNTFQHMPGKGGDNGNECIRLGDGSQSTFVSRTLVEFNYFTDTGLGDSEEISVKSRENVIRYNTMRNNPEAMLVFRNGDNNIAYGNFFIDAGGIRVKESNNIFCYNNYFERSGVGGSMNAVTYEQLNNSLQDINFFHNTFVESGLILFNPGATNNTWANNLISKSSGPIFSGTADGINWTGNMYSGTPGIAIPQGITAFNDLGLNLNATRYYGLTATSPAINAGVTFPTILDISGLDADYTIGLDLAGQTRDARKDVGAIEFNTTGTAINRPLALADAGPSYLVSPIRLFNAAGFQEGIFAQDSIVTMFGAGLADAAVNVTDSKGATRLAQIFFASDGQVNFLVPPSTATGQAVITAGAAKTTSATITTSAPGIFTLNGLSTVPAAFYLRVDAAGQRTQDLVFDPAKQNVIDIPRAAGDQLYLLLYGTGFRNTTAKKVTATANGQPVPVLGAVAQGQYPGLDQINIGPLPANLASGPVTVRLYADVAVANVITVRLQ